MELEKDVMKLSLVKMAAVANSIETELIENGGELTPELERTLLDINVQMPEKVDVYRMVLARLPKYQQEYKEKEAEMYSIRKGLENYEKGLKSAINTAMTIMETNDVYGYEYRFKRINNQPKLEVDHEVDIGEEFFDKVETRVLNRERLKEHLLATEKRASILDLEKRIEYLELSKICGVRLVRNSHVRPYLNRKK